MKNDQGSSVEAGATARNVTQQDHRSPDCAPASPPVYPGKNASDELCDLLTVREAMDRIVDAGLLGIRPDTHELIDAMRILGRVVDSRIQSKPIQVNY